MCRTQTKYHVHIITINISCTCFSTAITSLGTAGFATGAYRSGGGGVLDVSVLPSEFAIMAGVLPQYAMTFRHDTEAEPNIVVICNDKLFENCVDSSNLNGQVTPIPPSTTFTMRIKVQVR